jgi:predicted nucleic acid-binding protein
MAISSRCWDSDAILAWLLKEEGKWQDCQGVLHKAQEGELNVVVSSLAIAEVLMLRGHKKLPKDRAATVRDFFRNPWIKVRQLDRPIAEQAQELVWEHGIAPKDAVHVATAIRTRSAHLDTFDEKLIKKSGTVGGRLVICRPDVPYPQTLDEAIAT